MTDEQIQGGDVPDPRSADSDYLRTVVKKDIGNDILELIDTELSRSHSMANLSESELEELKHKFHARQKDLIASYPPQNSKLNGEVREILMNEEKKPLTDREIKEINRIYDVAYSRATLGKEAELLNLVSKFTQVNRMEKSDDSGEGDSGVKSDLKRMLGQ